MKTLIILLVISLAINVLVIRTLDTRYQNSGITDTVLKTDTIVKRDTVKLKFDTVKVYKKIFDTVVVNKETIIYKDTNTCFSIDTINDSVYVRADICGKLVGTLDSLHGQITYNLPPVTVQRIVINDTIVKTKESKTAAVIGTLCGVIFGGAMALYIRKGL